MLNPCLQHMMTFDHSGECHWIRLRPRLCHPLNKEVEIFPRCWMAQFDLSLLNFGLFHYFEWRECGWLHTIADHFMNWETSGLVKIVGGLLRMTDNSLLATLVPEWFDSADFSAHLEYFSSKLPPQLTLGSVRYLGDFWGFISKGSFFREASILAGGGEAGGGRGILWLSF